MDSNAGSAGYIVVTIVEMLRHCSISLCCGIVTTIAAVAFQNALKVFGSTKFIIVATNFRLILQDHCHNKHINVMINFR